ncbi:hypothetical protein DL240_10245 [Lujinxingia litoralis]|uniref:Uncharacterized protein n=1 Tax=Lujinxingia litoralis TaxID=2211119 RepID=A0A328C6Z2_9DELT|nr:hypothetical protein [Lujinxingia litoralis]RAL22224.1 hypothetical protein DL240_10245 [Lujinxingia litoralis]
MMMRWVGMAAALTLTACGTGDPEAWMNEGSYLGPVQVGEELVWADRTRAELVVVSPDRDALRGELKVAYQPTRENVVLLEPVPGGATVAALHGGSAPGVSLHDLDAGTRRDVRARSAFGRMTIDPDGAYVLLSHDPAAVGGEARNLNEVGLVDLRDEAAGEAEVLTLFSQPERLVFAPPFELDGQPYRLALGLSTSEINVIDLEAEHPDDRLRAIPLTVSQSDTPRSAVQVVIDTDDAPGTPESISIFVLTDVGSDITQIVVQPASSPEGGRRLALSVNQLYAGQQPVRFEVVDLPGVGRRIFAVDGARPQMTMVDVLSGESSTYELPMDVAPTGLQRFDVPGSQEDDAEPRLLVTSTRDRLVTLVRPELLTLASETPTVGRGLEAVRLQSPPLVSWFEGAAGKVVVGHEQGFSLIDLDTRRASYVSAAAPLANVARYSGGLFAVYQWGDSVVQLDVASGQTATTRIDGGTRALAVMPDKGLLVVLHDSPHGLLTLLPLDELVASRARMFDFVLLDRVLER